MAEKPSILEKLQEQRTKTFYEVWLPGCQQTIKFFPMSARQNKTLLAALVNAVKYQSESPIIQHDILRANLATPEFNLGALGPADVEVCLIALRAHNYSPTYEIYEDSKDEPIEVVDLLEHLKWLETNPVDFDPKAVVEIEHEGIQATVGEFSYDLDVKISIFMKTILDIQEKSGKSMDSGEQSILFSEVVGLQILKHIQSLTVDGETSKFAEIGVPEINLIGDNLPSAFFTKAAKAVVRYGKLAVDPVVTTQAGNNIKVDSAFFVIDNE